MSTSSGAAGLSDATFWIALGLYSAAALGSFHYLAARREPVRTAATVAAWAGLAVHVVSIVARGIAAGRMPLGNMFEFSSLLAALVVAAHLVVVEARMKVRTIGGFVLGFAAITMAVAKMALYSYPAPLVPALNSYWREIHVISVITGSSLLTLGGIFSILYLVKDRKERRAAAAAGAERGITVPQPAPIRGGSHELDSVDPPDYVAGADEPAVATARRRRGVLPSSETLDRLAYRTIAIAFPIWTFAILAGAIWAERAWGRYWGWDPKETWAFITWVVFAGYLHARATAGWKGRRAAYLGVAGFVSLLITYYAVNLFIVGLHSYAGV
ncbi:MAG: c-type cytochrome biogenesis protein CcsB [Actinobacteria bacterium]|nr:c-type cytochrome biogenesis protein CcsB [Actinomycetota bacterium]